MILVITKYGRTLLPLTYNDEELEKLMTSFIKKTRGHFRYSQLCNYIESKAMQEGKFKTEPYTRYTEMAMAECDHHRLSLLLWRMIWNKTIVIEFRPYDVRNGNNGDVLFGVVNSE